MEREGAEHFFGEPALELSDMMRTATNGKGIVSVLDATRLINSPKLYSRITSYNVCYTKLLRVDDFQWKSALFATGYIGSGTVKSR